MTPAATDPVTTVAPVPTTATTPAPAPAPTTTVTAPAAATQPATPTAADQSASQPAKTVSEALARLGIGTVVGTTVVYDASGAPVAAATSAQSCAPVISVGVSAAPAAVSELAGRQAVHAHRTAGDPPQLRGPPAPIDAPSSPVATVGGGAAAPGGASGERDCAIQLDQVVLELPDGGLAFGVDRCAPTAPAPANAGARAPPVA